MAASRLAPFLAIVQRSAARSLQSVAVSREAPVATFSRWPIANNGDGERSRTYGGFFANRQQHSQAESLKGKAEEVKQTGEEKVEGLKEEVKGKASELSSEGSKAKETVKEKASEVGEKASESTDEAKGQVNKNVETAKDMFNDLPQKVSETATGLKEVGVEAAKAAKRDAGKVAEKVGLKSE